MKKIGALLLAFVMVMSVCGVALASDAPAALGGDGEEGVVGQFNTGVGADNPQNKGRSINIVKEILAYNPNGTLVHAPVITYTYTVTPATVSSDLTITDEKLDHKSGEAATIPVKAGSTTGLVVTGATVSGTTATPVAGTAGNSSSASATLVFNNNSSWTTDVDGNSNKYNIGLDFTNVNFTQPGVYRYQIAETISAASYDVVAMKDGDFDVVYLDVYVDGNLNVYGYVCMTTNAAVTPSTTTKINGFVDGTDQDGSDKYYTYDLVLSKDVVNDTYATNNTAFPFTVIFSNPEGYTSTFTIDQTVGSGSTGLNSSAATLTGLPNTWSGVAHVKDGDTDKGTTVGDITLTGIPAGVDVDVYETNIATGVTYTVETSVNGATSGTGYTKDENVTWGATPASAVAQTAKKDYESTNAPVGTTKIAKTDAQSVAITNTLLTISPTGVTLRVAPYALILAAGIVVLLISRRRKVAQEEE